MMVTAYAAFATHVRPQAATPDRDPFVVAYDACTSPNTTHDGAYAVGSCDPPVKSSEWLSVGTPDSNGAPANMEGFVKNKVLPGNLATPADEADVLIHVELHDIRCTPALVSSAPAKCGSANTDDGPDYIGNMSLVSGIVLTDHRNDNSATPGFDNDPATVVPLPVPPLPIGCSATADPLKGSDCSITVSADAVAAMLGVEVAKEGTRAIWKGTSPFVTDGGDDGDISTAPNETFAVEGLFVP
jgi:hypothetical protein